MRRIFLGLLAVLISASATLIQPVVAQQTFDSSSQPLYINRAYGYTVALPPGLTYSRSVAPNPDHGIGISLGSGTSLWIDASYTDTESTEEAVRAATHHCRVESKNHVLLGKRGADSVRFFCSGSLSTRGYYEALVVTRFSNGDRAPANYEVGLRTENREDLSKYRSIFEKMVSGFQFDEQK